MGQSRETFEAALKAMDSLLSVRRGAYFPADWVVERVSYFAHDEVKYLVKRLARLKRRCAAPDSTEADKNDYLRVGEELTSARCGKRVIVVEKELGPKAYNNICSGDMLRYGGYSRYADEYEKREAEGEAAVEHNLSNARESINYEVWGRGGIYDHILKKRGTAGKLARKEQNVAQALGVEKPWWGEQSNPNPPAPLVDQFGRQI